MDIINSCRHTISPSVRKDVVLMLGSNFSRVFSSRDFRRFVVILLVAVGRLWWWRFTSVTSPLLFFLLNLFILFAWYSYLGTAHSFSSSFQIWLSIKYSLLLPLRIFPSIVWIFILFKLSSNHYNVSLFLHLAFSISRLFSRFLCSCLWFDSVLGLVDRVSSVSCQSRSSWVLNTKATTTATTNPEKQTT